MTDPKSYPDDEIDRSIAAWLANPDTCDFNRCDVDGILMSQQIADTWDHSGTERLAMMRLIDALMEYRDAQQRKMELEKHLDQEAEPGIHCFQTLSQAVDFISELLENDSAETLMTNRADRYFPDPYGLLDMDDFKNRLFPQLQAYHREQNFRLRYKGRQFPANRNRFTLGGHESELGCINILFLKLDRGWVLDKIFICR